MSEIEPSPPIQESKSRPALPLPSISPTVGLALLAAIGAVILVVGYLAGTNAAAGGALPYFVVGILAVFALVGVAGLVIYSLINTLASLILVPYGVHDATLARSLVLRSLNTLDRPRVYVREGEVAPESDRSLLQTTRRGRGLLDVDPTSVVLIDRNGKQELLAYGLHELRYRDRILGMVSLRQQREVMEYSRVLTRDAMSLGVRVIVVYQIQQDARHLQRHGTHLTSIEAVRRAVMPRSEWKERTKRAVASKVQELIGARQLFEIFIEPTAPELNTGTLVTGLSFGKPPPAVRAELRTRLMESLQSTVSQWGVEIVTVSLDELTPPKEISEKAHIAYETWLERTGEIEKAERHAEMERRIAQTRREQAALERETEIIHAETKASAEQHAAEIERATSRIRSETEAERKRFEAESEKDASLIRAQSEADAHRIQMAAKTEAGVELARRLELLQDGTGRSLDDRTMREFLRAIGFLQVRDSRHPDGRWRLRDMYDMREDDPYERRFETEEDEEE